MAPKASVTRGSRRQNLPACVPTSWLVGSLQMRRIAKLGMDEASRVGMRLWTREAAAAGGVGLGG